MTVTFPHMGTLQVILKALVTAMGTQVLVPPPTNKTTLELGARYAPETACLPFKTTLGNFIQALEAGADTILTCGGEGPCRLGYYAAIQEEILRDLGYKFTMIVVEPNLGSAWQALRQLAAAAGWRQILHAFRLAGAKLRALDTTERAACQTRPRCANVAAVETVRLRTVAAIDAADSPAAVDAAVERCRRSLAAIAVRKGLDPLRVGLVGEIYVMLDSYINSDLVSRLGRMGVAVEPTMLLGDYVRAHILHDGTARRRASEVAALAAPYLGHYVGGHGLGSIGHTVAAARAGFDGMVHVFPFTCMPEVIARNILPGVSDNTGIPVLSLPFDEQTGEAGLVTRLEAFVDLLRYRRRKDAQK